MKAKKKIKVLFVCTGNTCRSPMAKVILEKLLLEHELQEKVEVDSAGIVSLWGSPASRTAVEVCRENGLDLSTHQSKRLCDNLIQSVDLIVVMEQMHRELIGKSNPCALQKTRLLSEFARGRTIGPDIEDPYGGEKYHYQRAFSNIELCLEGLIPGLTEYLPTP